MRTSCVCCFRCPSSSSPSLPSTSLSLFSCLWFMTWVSLPESGTLLPFCCVIISYVFVFNFPSLFCHSTTLSYPCPTPAYPTTTTNPYTPVSSSSPKGRSAYFSYSVNFIAIHFVLIIWYTSPATMTVMPHIVGLSPPTYYLKAMNPPLLWWVSHPYNSICTSTSICFSCPTDLEVVPCRTIATGSISICTSSATDP